MSIRRQVIVAVAFIVSIIIGLMIGTLVKSRPSAGPSLLSESEASLLAENVVKIIDKEIADREKVAAMRKRRRELDLRLTTLRSASLDPESARKKIDQKLTEQLAEVKKEAEESREYFRKLDKLFRRLGSSAPPLVNQPPE